MTDCIDLEEYPFNESTKRNLRVWLEGDYDEETKNEICLLIKEDPSKISDAFSSLLSFGTGGLRGIVGLGSNRFNRYTLGLTIQGLADYIKKQEATGLHSVLIGYDSRCHSQDFAEQSAKILAGNGIKVLLFREIRPSPLVSFGCRFKKCSAAIMITASHNPANYNGCKVYWSDGGQVVDPNDKGIIEAIKAVPGIKAIQNVSTLVHPLIEWIDKEIDDAYLLMIAKLQNYREDNQKSGETLKIIYTSLHGTGITLMPKAFQAWGFKNVHFVEEQVISDGNFPTVAFPNPENREALAMGISKLQREGADILIATDPDADRVGVAIMHEGEVRVLSGNELAVLLLQHLCEVLTKRNKMPANAAFIKTIATTDLFSAIADYYQKPCLNVLPGFKYIAEKIHQWELDPGGNQFVFGAEDSNGYLAGTEVRDKDAISASVLICEMALQAKIEGKTLLHFLHFLYERYGIYYEESGALEFPDTWKGRQKMMRCMEFLQRGAFKKILHEEVDVLEDYKRSLRIDLRAHTSEPILYPKSDALLFRLSSGGKLLIRPSGTESKIKLYCGTRKKQFQSIQSGIEACKLQAKGILEALKKIVGEYLES